MNLSEVKKLEVILSGSVLDSSVDANENTDLLNNFIEDFNSLDDL